MPLHPMFNNLSGKDGYVVVKGLGSRPGELAQWSIKRRGGEGPRSGTIDLRAVFSFVVPHVLLDPDYNDGRELVLKLSRDKEVRVKLDDPERMALTGKVLVMEGIDIT
jgi:hypothetical protein